LNRYERYGYAVGYADSNYESMRKIENALIIKICLPIENANLL
jgi:hypothetical protein